MLKRMTISFYLIKTNVTVTNIVKLHIYFVLTRILTKLSDTIVQFVSSTSAKNWRLYWEK